MIVLFIVKTISDAFEIEFRETSIFTEILTGFIHFISCLFVLPVIPDQLESAGYNKKCSIEATAMACCIGCVLSSYLTNLPFVVAPPTAVSIFLSVALRKSAMSRNQGDTAVIISGFALLLIGIFKPLMRFFTNLIPDCIQASTAVGIGLITALAGAIELKLVIPGKFTILEMGPITPSIVIAIVSTVIIALALHHHVKGAFISGMIFGTITFWLYSGTWPTQYGSLPSLETDSDMHIDKSVLILLADLLFLYILVLNGIARSMSDLANLTNAEKGAIPRGNWLFIVCGVTTILSGYFSGPPILISPESAAGIKAGGRTGLSTLVCGLLFGLSVFLGPLFSTVPPSGTTPLLILVGMLLFVNVSRIKWTVPSEAIPSFFVLLLIPFTYSILCGVGFGYVLYILISLFTGRFFAEASQLLFLPSTAPEATAIDAAADSSIAEDSCELILEEGEHGDKVGFQKARGVKRARSASVAVRQRAGSLVDKLPMDLASNIHSMRS